jgi:hypothetical protein
MGKIVTKDRRKVYILDDLEKKKADAAFAERPDIIWIVQQVWKDASLDGRSMQGKALAEYFAAENKEYKTTKYEKSAETLTDEQVELLTNEVFAPGKTALDIARFVLDDLNLKPLSVGHRLVQQWLKQNRPEIMHSSGEVSGKWTPPASVAKVVGLVNEHVGTNFKREELSEKIRRQMSALKNILCSKRFYIMINELLIREERDLVESSLVKHIWDKPDLTYDEENMYISVCMAYVDQVHARKRKDKLHQEVMNCTDKELSIKLNENLKTASDEVDKIGKSISETLKRVTEMRNKRIESGGGNSSTMISIVEAWQEEEERKRLLIQRRMRASLVSEEADKFENVEDFKARILGISKEEIV